MYGLTERPQIRVLPFWTGWKGVEQVAQGGGETWLVEDVKHATAIKVKYLI